MTRDSSGELDPEVEDALDDRWTYERTPLDRGLFYLVLAMLGGTALAGWTGHGDLVAGNADLIAVVVGLAGLVWTLRDAERGVTRFGYQGYWEVRREEHPVRFRLLIAFYGLGFLGALVGGLAYRLGWRPL